MTVDDEVIDVETKPLPDEAQPDEDKEKEDTSQEAAEAETEDTGDDGAAEPPKKKGRVQKRIDKLTAELRATQRENAELKRKSVEDISTQPAAKPLNEADFENYEDFLVAKATEKAEERVAARLDEERKQREVEAKQSRETELAVSFDEKAEAARAKYEDFDEVAFDPSTPVTGAMMNAILESDVGPEIAYHLGSNHQEARRISQLSPVSQAREIGKLEVALTAEPPKKQTTAPDPPNTLKGKATAQKDPSKMSTEEYRAFRRGQ